MSSMNRRRSRSGEPLETLSPNDDVPASVDRRRRRRSGGSSEPAPARRWVWWLLAIGLVVFVLYYWREPLAERLLPTPPQISLLQQAEQALAEGRLSSPDGQGARELFAAVLALSPDHSQAREGLNRVSERALAEARQALASDQRELARERLSLARSVGAAEDVLAPLSEELRRRDSVEDELARLLADARAAEQAGNLDGDADSALAHYRKMLERAPGNPVARAGRDAVLKSLLSEARDALSSHDVERGARLIARVAEVDPGFIGLPAAQAELSAAVDEELVGIRSHIERGELDQAEVLLGPLRQALGPHEAVGAEVDRLASGWLDRAESHLAEAAFESAQLALLRARALKPDLQRADALAASVVRERARAQTAPADPSARLAQLLDEGEAAMRAGRWFPPERGNAWAHLQEAYQLAPGDLSIGKARLRVAREARSCLDAIRAPADLPRAEHCLAVLDAFDPEDPTLPDLRRNLAARWLGIAQERLGAGELDAARRAFDAAARIDPQNPDLAGIEQRLNRAQPL